jgi:hypothetical protein
MKILAILSIEKPLTIELDIARRAGIKDRRVGCGRRGWVFGWGVGGWRLPPVRA